VGEPDKLVDSELGLKYILQQRRGGLDLRAATKRLESFTRPNRALNLLVLDAPQRAKPQLFVKHQYKKDLGDPEDRTRYYDIHYQTMPGGMAAFSSTLTLVDWELSQATLLDIDGLTSFAELS